jgi:hypothetical protein
MQAAHQRLPPSVAKELQRAHALIKSDADVGSFSASVVEQLQLFLKS